MVLALLPSVLCFSFKFCLLLNIFCLLGFSCINPGLLIFFRLSLLFIVTLHFEFCYFRCVRKEYISNASFFLTQSV